MNKVELIEGLAADCGTPKAVAERVINAFIARTTEALARGDSVVLVGFGTFSTVKRAARTGRNPQTGGALEIKAARIARFKPGSNLKKAVL